MLFNSLEFIIFFILVLLIYFLIPKKFKNLYLLIASFIFYMAWNVKYIFLILFTILATYFSALIMNKYKNKKKLMVWICIIINFLILLFFKYFNFFTQNIVWILSFFNIHIKEPNFDILLPIGISFFTFQSLGYVIDVYRDTIKPEKNFVNYALFVSFFPQLIAGPIERSKNLLSQINSERKINYDSLKRGLWFVVWGFFLKLVIADRIGIFVDSVYASDYNSISGTTYVVASILFAFQVYCDFYGYSVIAKGTAKMLGIDLMDNFNTPFLSRNISEFWRRWHISLGTWFRDYLYIPLGGNRVGVIRKYLNICIVFMISALWHGSNWTFVIWGIISGLSLVIGRILKPFRDKFNKICGLNSNNFSHRMMQHLFTFILFFIPLAIFRADTVAQGLNIIKCMFTDYAPWVIVDGSLFNYGINVPEAFILFISLMILIFVDVCKYKNIDLISKILNQNYWFRCLLLIFVLYFIIIFGIWGTTYSTSSFIYFQF